jgi:hypothetical protein
MRTKIGEEVLPLLDKVQPIFAAEKDPVVLQKAIEMLVVLHCLKVGNSRDALFVAESMAKHVRQLLAQFFEEDGS